MSLVPALDPEHPNDYFLFLATTNDFSRRAGRCGNPTDRCRAIMASATAMRRIGFRAGGRLHDE
jgi:hypothetical protein